MSFRDDTMIRVSWTREEDALEDGVHAWSAVEEAFPEITGTCMDIMRCGFTYEDRLGRTFEVVHD